jgi:hypothetical protein
MKSIKSMTYWRVRSAADPAGRRTLIIACSANRRFHARRIAGRRFMVLRLSVRFVAEELSGFEPVIHVRSASTKP